MAPHMSMISQKCSNRLDTELSKILENSYIMNSNVGWSSIILICEHQIKIRMIKCYHSTKFYNLQNSYYFHLLNSKL